MNTARHLEIARENKALEQVDRDGMAHYIRHQRRELGASRGRQLWRTVYSYAPDLSSR